MRKLNIAICDDERVIHEQIRALIRMRRQDICIEVYETGDALLASGKQFDIIFLDIQMRGINGIETARILREHSMRMREEEALLIFMADTRDYAFEAFEVAAFHYLLKPIEESKLREVFHRAERELEKRTKRQQEPIFIKTRNRCIALDRDSIIYIESRGKKVALHTTREIIEVYSSMNELEEQLGTGFFRCHRGYLVNVAYVSEYNNESITLNNGDHIYLAKKKYREFAEIYMRYLRNGACTDN